MIGSWMDCLFGGDGWRRRSRCASVVQELLNDHRYTSRSRLSPQTRIKQNKAFRFMRRSLFSAHLQQLVTTNQMLRHQDCMWSRAEADQLSQNMLSEPSTRFWLMRTTGYSVTVTSLFCWVDLTTFIPVISSPSRFWVSASPVLVSTSLPVVMQRGRHTDQIQADIDRYKEA